MTSNYNIESTSTKIFLAVLCLIQHFMGMESVLLIPAGTRVILIIIGTWKLMWSGKWCLTNSLLLQ